ncbi:MAG: hypothetical protein IJN32_04820, partial [Thermoguttaceae bacterium]|nr:hypothetical protein [Thermoguttaceae bacterium]
KSGENGRAKRELRKVATFERLRKTVIVAKFNETPNASEDRSAFFLSANGETLRREGENDFAADVSKTFLLFFLWTSAP